jgi:hypothetical protein
LITVHSSDDDLAFPERLGRLLPFAGESPDAGLRLETIDHHLGEVKFGRFGGCVGAGASDQSVQVGVLDPVVIVDDISLES